jgi:pyroglutamyl-peptidase
MSTGAEKTGSKRTANRRDAAAGTGAPVLVTGFGPFPGVPVNPSEAIVAALGRVPGARLTRRRLATTWDGLPALDGLLAGVRIAVHVGVAPRARRLRIETIAVDARHPAPDAAGRLPALLATSGAVRRGRAVAAPLVAAARATGVPAGISGDAGRYLCNALYFRSLAAAETAVRPHLSVFVHVPPPAVQRGRRLADLTAAVAAVIAALVTQTRPPRPAARSRRQPKSRSRAL